MKYATIVGSRSISKEEFRILREIATKLCFEGYTLRSGAADGADSTINHLHQIEIILPWSGFNGFLHDGERVFALEFLPHVQLAIKKAKSIHPRPDLLKNAILKFHARNIYQVIGPKGADGVKSDIVIYCADDITFEVPKGGTRTAVMYAKELNIPVYNIRDRGFNISAIFSEIQQLIENSG